MPKGMGYGRKQNDKRESGTKPTTSSDSSRGVKLEYGEGPGATVQNWPTAKAQPVRGGGNKGGSKNY